MHSNLPLVTRDADVEVKSDGSVRVVDEGARGRFALRAGEFALVLDHPELLVLRKAGDGARVLMAGEIIGRMTIMEICNVIAQTGWRGDLHVSAGESHRVLSFDQGALKSARSDSDDDRLGEVLFRMGLIDRTQLTKLADGVGEKRFGELAVEDGEIDAQQLYSALQRQAQDIFYAALIVDEGSYVFALPSDDEEPSGTTIHLPVQGLLMEGVQRIDEMALFRDKIPSSQMCPVPIADAPVPKKADLIAQRLLAECDGERTIEDLMRIFGMSEFELTKAVYQLLQSKQVELRTPSKIDPTRVRMVVGRFNDILQDIFVAVATYGGLTQTRATLEAWIQGSGYAPYFGEGVDEFGAIDPELVVNSLSRVAHEHPLEALHQALHELAAFALFSATTTLPRDQELSLARDVNARLKAIRIE